MTEPETLSCDPRRTIEDGAGLAGCSPERADSRPRRGSCGTRHSRPRSRCSSGRSGVSLIWGCLRNRICRHKTVLSGRGVAVEPIGWMRLGKQLTLAAGREVIWDGATRRPPAGSGSAGRRPAGTTGIGGYCRVLASGRASGDYCRRRRDFKPPFCRPQTNALDSKLGMNPHQ